MLAHCLRLGWLLLVPAIVVGIFLVNDREPQGSAAPEPAKEAKPAFQVPPGFVVEKVAGPPLVEYPMMAGFDERGRLFVAENAGVNIKFDELLKNPPSFIRLLEDSDGDGRFDKSGVFADKLAFPMGALWHDGALYTASPPSLWRLEDTDGDGVADQRQELVTKFGSTGNAADIHGPFPGPDGRLYWCDGRHGHEIKRPDGSLMQGKAARIFRCKPDGSEVEVVCGGGMDNPVEIAFTPEGEPLATVDILISKPQRIDAIIYCIEGGVYPHHEAVIKEFKRTGDLLPAVGQLGWVAPAGLTRYRGDAFGAEYRGNLFSAQFNMHRIQRHVLERDGAAFRIRSEDFLVSTDPDFHPTDVFEDADGSLLVIDTGGWFRIGCPTSQIAKPEFKGGIYRVRRTPHPNPLPRGGRGQGEGGTDPRGLSLKWNQLASKELVPLLDDPRFAVRDRAIELLAKKGTAAIPPLQEALAGSSSAEARRNAIWTLARIDHADARAAVRVGLEDKDAGVRLAATHVVGLYRDAEALPQLTKLVTTDAPALRRESATALGRIHKASAVPALLEGLRTGGDRFLEHALIYALIEIADREATLKGLRDPSPFVRRGALIALDQMDGGNLTREQVTPLLDTDDPALQQTALAIITARPTWAKEIIGLLGEWLTQKELDASRQDSLRGAIIAFCKDAAIQELIVQALSEEKTAAPTRLLLLETMSRVPLDKLPPAWITALGRSLEHGDERVVRQAVTTIRAAAVADFDETLLRLAGDKARPADLRVAALAAAAPRLSKVDADSFRLLIAQLDKDVVPLQRLAAAEALGNAKLEDAQLQSLADAVAAAGALEMPHLLAAYERGKDKDLGLKLVAALAKSPGLQSLSVEVLRQTFKGYPPEVQQAAEPLFKKLAVDVEQQKARLAELQPVLAGGDARRGRDVFFGKKATCAACHAVQSEGGRIGPDLTKIGAIRTNRDLLEAVVFPSTSFARGYQPFVILTQAGKIHTGVISRETPDAIYLHTLERAEVRIPRGSIESIDPGRVSVMPLGLDAQLSREELADLMAYMMTLR